MQISKCFVIGIAMILSFTMGGPIFGQQSVTGKVCLTKEEIRLAELINNFRKQNRLPEIPLSVSLTYVAKTHVSDLQINSPDTSICTTASWSNKGKWTPCCYNRYVLKPECMWDKPKELTSYNYRGYEIVHFEEGIVQVDTVFKLWRTTTEVMDMLLSRAGHSDKKWLAMGIGLSENYVSIWLGQRNDAAGRPAQCSKQERVEFVAEFQDTTLVNSKEKAAKYYLIYGSFSTRSDANEAVRRYRNTGLKNVLILEKEGRFRVALDVFNNLRDAMEAKESMNSSYPEAWIFKD